MFIGHYAPAFAAATSPKSPRLAALFVAAQLVDIAFFSFLILGVEKMRMLPGAGRLGGWAASSRRVARDRIALPMTLRADERSLSTDIPAPSDDGPPYRARLDL